MANIAIDGFDNYNSSNAPGHNYNAHLGPINWSPVAAASPNSNVRGVTGTGYSLFCTSGLSGIIANRISEFYMGFAYQIQSYTGSGTLFRFTFTDTVTNTDACEFIFDYTNNMVRAYRGSAENGTAVFLGTSLSGVINMFNWNYIEVHVKIDSSVGIMECKVNGAVVLSLTGQNTKGNANGVMNTFLIGSVFSSYSIEGYIDDFYINDTTTGAGTYPCNGYMGDSRVMTLFPTGNSTVQWSPSAGTNYQNVDNPTFTDGTSYNSTSTAGQSDDYVVQPLNSYVTSVYTLWVVGAYEKSDAGTRTLEQFVSNSGTVTAGATHTLAIGYNFYSDQFAVNPATGASWTTSGVDNMLAGYELVS